MENIVEGSPLVTGMGQFDFCNFGRKAHDAGKDGHSAYFGGDVQHYEGKNTTWGGVVRA